MLLKLKSCDYHVTQSGIMRCHVTYHSLLFVPGIECGDEPIYHKHGSTSGNLYQVTVDLSVYTRIVSVTKECTCIYLVDGSVSKNFELRCVSGKFPCRLQFLIPVPHLTHDHLVRGGLQLHACGERDRERDKGW